MNKILPLIGAGIIGIGLPVVGLSITPTRDALLSLTTPDEKILALADKIDENRVSSEETDSKITELQSTIDAQQVKLAEQQKLIDEQNVKVVNQEANIAENKATTDCAMLYSSAPFCNTDGYRNKTDFEKTINNINKQFSKPESYINIATEKFNKCEKIRTKCN